MNLSLQARGGIAVLIGLLLMILAVVLMHTFFVFFFGVIGTTVFVIGLAIFLAAPPH